MSRYWKGNSNDDGSIHCLGNGEMLVYGQGPDIVQAFGPPYSSPSLIQLNMVCKDFEVVSSRKPKTAVWEHVILDSGQRTGEILDFVDSQIPCLVRRLILSQSIEFILNYHQNAIVSSNTSHFGKWCATAGLLVAAEAGTFLYGRYPVPGRLYSQLIITGNAEISNENCHNGVKIKCGIGESRIYYIGGPDYPECINYSEEALNCDYGMLFERTVKFWRYYSASRYDFEQILHCDTPMRDVLLNTIDEIAVLIKVQQSTLGAVIAGHNYHLAYVRDQYGVSRCLLMLGYIKEAKAILDFYWKVWSRYGKLHNAQAAGVDGIFHVHENDDVEITGYLIIQAFDYLKATKEEGYLKEIFPMLEWAWEAQKKHLVNYMLPFNGDETYVAGGVLPRNTLNDGSAEATLLFITAGERLLHWIEKNNVWEQARLIESNVILELTRNNYRSNFWDGNELLTNNPERVLHIKLPRYRHGVCEACFDFGWTGKNENDRYICPKCFNLKEVERCENKRFKLRSVSLMPIHIGASMFSSEETAIMVEEILTQYRKSGKLPSRPDDNITVGYDYGLLLYNLAEIKHPMVHELYLKTLEVLDQTNAWVEYYDDGKPKGTRCRPWESGINLEAAIKYATGIQNNQSI